MRGRIEALVIASLTESNGAADALVAAFEYDWAAAIFAFLVAEPGWEEGLPRIAEQYSTMWVVPNFVYERLKKARKMTRQRLQEGQRAIEGLISGFAEQEGAGDDD